MTYPARNTPPAVCTGGVDEPERAVGFPLRFRQFRHGPFTGCRWFETFVPAYETVNYGWHVDLTDRFGVEQYPFGKDATLSLLCHERSSAAEEPQVEIRSDRPVTVEIFWDEGRRSKTVTVDGN